MRRLLKALLALLPFCALPLFAQYTSVSGSYAGPLGSAVANGTVYWQAVSAARIGTTSGQLLGVPVTATVTAGAFTMPVNSIADTSLSNPANTCYAVTIIDNLTGQTLLGAGLAKDGIHVNTGGAYGCVQPSGSTWSFDTFIPAAPPNAIVIAGPTGPAGPACSTGSGTCNMTVPIVLPADPTTSLQAATKHYVDTLPGAVNLSLAGVTQPAAGPTVALGSSGNPNGTYQYAVLFVTATGLGYANSNTFSATISPVNQQVLLTSIPTSADPTVTGRAIYRSTAAGNVHAMQLVTTINDNTTTSYTDNFSDGSLTTLMPWTPTGFGQVAISGLGTILKAGYSSLSIGANTGPTLDGYADTFVGPFSGQNTTTGMYNVGVGTFSFAGSPFTGQQNVAVGVHACGGCTTASNNAALGWATLQNDTTGGNNVAVGAYSLTSNVSGGGNVGIGLFALELNTGNANTAVGTNALASNTTPIGNSALGYYALSSTIGGTGNTAVGYNAVTANVSGTGNTGMGYDAMLLDTGGSNTAVGYAALAGNTTANGSTAIGYNALNANSTATGNTAVGYQSMQANTTGVGNAAFGFTSLVASNGGFDSGFGYDALVANTSGGNDTAAGFDALGGNTSGSNNTGVGSQAGQYITGGSTANATTTNSTFLGTNTEAKADGDANETAVGYGAIGNGSNSVTLGNSSVTDVYAGTAAVFHPSRILPSVLYSAAGTALPTCNSGLKGTQAVVSDATTPTYMGAYASGGAVTAAVICSYNGSTYAWLTH